MSTAHHFTPREIVSELDHYVIGQREAKRAVAVALRNRWRRQQVPADCVRRLAEAAVRDVPLPASLQHLVEAEALQVVPLLLVELVQAGLNLPTEAFRGEPVSATPEAWAPRRTADARANLRPRRSRRMGR